MGWTISHAPYDETIRRSATSIGELAKQLAHAMPSHDWRTVQQLFNRRSGDPFEIDWQQAGRMADALYLASCNARLPLDWAELTRQLAQAASQAANQREPWHWS